MDKLSRIFIGEFITGGGVAAAELSALAHEGDMMVRALIQDLLDAGYEEIICPRNTGLSGLHKNIQTPDPGTDYRSVWQQCLQACAVAWIIAPEKDKVLYELSIMAQSAGCQWAGCTPAAIALTTSKSRTVAWLHEHHIKALPCFPDAHELVENNTGWILKPDDGVGAEGCYRFDNLATLQKHIQEHNPQNYIIQEYLPGIAASLTVLCHQGDSRLLACNEQLTGFSGSRVQLHGIVINGLRQHEKQCAALAATVARAIAGLNGIVGIDFILTPAGPVLLEINPRLTTAYAGLHESLGLNPAALVMDMLENGSLPELGKVNYQPVTIRF